MTLLVVADQHIGAGASLGDRLADQRASWLVVCEKAVELGATVLHAGDVFHARRPGPTEMRAYQDGLDVLRAGGCEMIVAAGNHDVQSADSPTAVEVASAGYAVHVCREPQAIETPDGVVGFLPWMPPRMSAKQTADALMIVAESLAEQGARILIAHWALAGGSLPNGLPLLELAEPTLDPYRLAEQFEVTLAGHIHKPQVIVGEPNQWPRVLHTGPLSRLNFGEAGISTGAWELALMPDGIGGSFIGASWFEVPDRRFVSIECDARESGSGTDLTPTEMVLDEISEWDVEGAIIRVTWQQTADQVVDQSAVLARLAGAHHVDRLQPLVERVVSTRAAGLNEGTDPRASFDTWLSAQDAVASQETLDRVRSEAHAWIVGAA